MTEFRNNETLIKATFDCRAYSLDMDINRIWADFDSSNVKSSTIKRHITRISDLLDDFQALQHSDIDVVDIDVGFLQSLLSLLSQKYQEMQ
jgi:hypothetical protein